MLTFRLRKNPKGFINVALTVLIVAFMTNLTAAVTKKAIVDWSPNGEPFRDPMLDHAALVELHLMDRIVFTCDSTVPAVIYRVSEESFDECKYDLSAEWIGECTAGTKYITVTLRSNLAGATQSAYNANTTYFFTSFSSGTRSGVHDKSGALCLMGVRLILEIRRSSKRVPLLTHLTTSDFDVIQVPVQRVSYGGRPTTRRLFSEMSTTPPKKRNVIIHSFDERSDEREFWSGWPWSRHRSNPTGQAQEYLPSNLADIRDFEWEPLSMEYFNYSSARYPPVGMLLSCAILLFIT